MDVDQTFDLVQLICDLEPFKRHNTEFHLIYRKDCPLWVPRKFAEIAFPKFGTALASQARNHDVGWPGGSNMLAGSAMMEMALLFRYGACRNDAYLLFEPDCVPLQRDWIDQLSEEWIRTKAAGKQAFGHWNMPGGDPQNLHMNGNAVFASNFHDHHPDIWIGPATQGWDFWFRNRIIPLSVDSHLITQFYNRATITKEEISTLTKNGKVPVMLHGIKDDSARRSVRELLLT